MNSQWEIVCDVLGCREVADYHHVGVYYMCTPHHDAAINVMNEWGATPEQIFRWKGRDG